MRTTQLIPLILLFCLSFVRGDQVEMRNGDRYIGNVLSVSASEVRLDNEINGLMKLPRNKVRAIVFGANVPAVSVPPLLVPKMNAPAGEDALGKIKKGEIDPKALEQVQSDILGTAGPEANAMFNDLLKGLMTGRVSSEDLRNQARQTMDQLKSLQKEAGEDDSNPLLGNYLGILQKFIEEGRTNRPAAAVTDPPAKAP